MQLTKTFEVILLFVTIATALPSSDPAITPHQLEVRKARNCKSIKVIIDRCAGPDNSPHITQIGDRFLYDIPVGKSIPKDPPRNKCISGGGVTTTTTEWATGKHEHGSYMYTYKQQQVPWPCDPTKSLYRWRQVIGIPQWRNKWDQCGEYKPEEIFKKYADPSLGESVVAIEWTSDQRKCDE